VDEQLVTPHAGESVEARWARFNAELDRLARFRTQPGHTLAELMEQAVHSVSKTLGVSRASVWFLNEDDTALECACLLEAEAGQVSQGASLEADRYPAYFKAFRESRVIDAHDAITDPRTAEFAVGYLDVLGITSMLDTQISDRHKLRGVVCCEHTASARTWRAEEVSFVAAIGEYIGLALELFERERLNIELERSNARLRAAIASAEAAKTDAEKANRLKTQFLANTSHELKTPLNGILGGVTILRQEHDPEAQGKWLDIIEQSGKWLLYSVNGLLDLAALEDGALRPKYEQIQVPSLIKEAARLAVQPTGLAPDLRFEFSGLPADRLTVRSDSGMLGKIVANFVSNAAKFAPGGPIMVTATPGEIYPTGVRISVLDDGEGLDPDRIEELFERFTQGDGSSSRRFGGTGLGLAICREYAALIGGQVFAANREEGGAVFSVEIPARPIGLA